MVRMDMGKQLEREMDLMGKVIFVRDHLIYWLKLLTVGIFNAVTGFFRFFSHSPFVAIIVVVWVYWLVQNFDKSPLVKYERGSSYLSNSRGVGFK